MNIPYLIFSWRNVNLLCSFHNVIRNIWSVGFSESSGVMLRQYGCSGYSKWAVFLKFYFPFYRPFTFINDSTQYGLFMQHKLCLSIIHSIMFSNIIVLLKSSSKYNSYSRNHTWLVQTIINVSSLFQFIRVNWLKLGNPQLHMPKIHNIFDNFILCS